MGLLDRLPAPIRSRLYAGGTRRDRLEKADAVVAALGLRPGMIVGDLGPGNGHFTLRMARAVEPDGVVHALDASLRTLDELREAADERGITTLRTARVPRDRLEAPAPMDLLFVSATYHHLPNPTGYFADAREHLKAEGRVVILEARRQGLLARWQGRHASPPNRVLDEMRAAGYRIVAEHDLVPGYLFAEFVPSADVD
ncbi:MAG: methyltransferase domain-containing protein [Chloroflexi bacterium]|nr:methyltransferase domain-containing protein [Chloroflexota bacterium]